MYGLLQLSGDLRHLGIHNHVLKESAVFDYCRRTLKCLILDCHVEPVDTQILRHVQAALEILLNQLAPLLSIEGLRLVKPVELDWAENEGSPNSLIKSLLEIPRFV